MLVILLPILAMADLQADLSKATYLNDILTSLLKSTQDNHLNQIQEQLKSLELEIERAEKSISQLEHTIVNLAQNHANFNSTEANLVKNLVNSIDEYITVLDAKVRSVDFSTVKSTIPKAIVGQATGDFQAFHSVDKIKQESIKLESSIIGNSKFIWTWCLCLFLILISIYLFSLINKATKSNL